MCAVASLRRGDGRRLPHAAWTPHLTCRRKDARLSATQLGSEVTGRPVGAEAQGRKPHRASLIGLPQPTGCIPPHRRPKGAVWVWEQNRPRKWAKSGGSRDSQMASPSCMNDSIFTKRVIFLMLFPENCFQRHRLCTQDGNDFLMTLRGLGVQAAVNQSQWEAHSEKLEHLKPKGEKQTTNIYIFFGSITW